MSDHAIMVRSDARAMSSVTALSTRVSDRWKSSDADKRTFGGKAFTGTSECVSYRIDPETGERVDIKLFRTRHVNRNVAGITRSTPKAPQGMTYAERVNLLGAIGNID